MHKFFYVLAIFGCLFNQSIHCQNLRIGIIDSFSYQKYVSTNYEKFYMDGFNLAKENALKKGIKIEYQVFRYQYDELSIIQAIKKMQDWKPDVIIGPRDSKSFLTLGLYIKDTLCISPFATSLKIKILPPNFHTMTYQDDYTAKLFANFLQKDLKAKSIYSLVELDCQSCKDLAGEVEKNYRGSFKKNYFLKGNVEDDGIDELLKNYNNENHIFLPNTAHATSVLMIRLSNHLKKNLIFIGGDGWGTWGDSEVGQSSSKYPMQAYHITPWALEIEKDRTKHFKQDYSHFYLKKPSNKLSYIIYETTNSIVESAVDMSEDCKKPSEFPKQLLCSYKEKNAKQPQWYKPEGYAVFKIENRQNHLFKVIN